jgi:hypothetical protein
VAVPAVFVIDTLPVVKPAIAWFVIPLAITMAPAEVNRPPLFIKPPKVKLHAVYCTTMNINGECCTEIHHCTQD